MNHKLGCNYEQFDACVKSGAVSAKLVGLVKHFDSPSPGKTGVHYETISPRRVSCSLSGVCLPLAGTSARSRGRLGCSKSRCKSCGKHHSENNEATSPCAVRTRDGTIVRRMDIGRRNLLGPALAGASVRDGEGQPNFPGQQRRKTSAPYAGVVVFFLSLPSRRLEQSPPFLGGAVLCSSFSFSLLIHVSTWTDL